MHELEQRLVLLAQCLAHEYSNENDFISPRPIGILKDMMSLYTEWCTTTRPSSRLKFKASAAIDEAFRLVTNAAFSTPCRLSWVNLGIEALQLQLHSGDFYVNLNVVNSTNIGGSSMKLIPLQRPYDDIPKGTWLRALRALTSKDMNSSRFSPATRQVRALSPRDKSQWIASSNAAFRILQRLIKGKGIRTFQKTKPGQQPQQQSLDERDFNMVLHAYASYPQNRYMHAAHRVMALQERTAHAPPLSPVAYSILLKAYGRLGDIKNVEMGILNAQRNRVIPDIVMANTVVDAYVNCGLIDKANDVFRSMTATSVNMESREAQEAFWPLLRPNTRTYNTLLKGMAGVGDIGGALKLSRVVQSNGLWDEITTNTLVKAAVAANEYDLAEDILSNYTVTVSSPQKADHPNVEAYTELIDGYAKDGQLENSLRVMQVMRKRDVTPNEYTYTCIVGALARNNKVRQARKMIDYAASLPSNGGKRMDLTPTYNAFISGLLSDNRDPNAETTGQSSHAANMIEVLAVFQEMLGSKIYPNVVTVALVVDGLGRCNPPRCREARELVEHLEFQMRFRQNGNYHQNEGQNVTGGMSLSNNKIATALIQAYGRANDVESAIESFKRIISPDVVAFNALLDSCCRCDQLKLALDLFKKHARFDQSIGQESKANTLGYIGEEIFQKSIKPDVVTYTTLISALLQLKSRAATKRAISLYSEMKQMWWISPDNVLVDSILTAMISGGPNGFEDDDVKFTLMVLQDGARLKWENGQYEKRKKAVRGILVGRTSEIWKNDEFSFGLFSEQPEDPLFVKKGWNKIDSGFRLWGGGGNKQQQLEGRSSSVDSFLASKGWNDIDSGFRLV
ncbi:hypothetical protein ACHAW5_004391 [Stephanodiscus triporus]|uniref:Pentacotripeptide-repeat region of PRORP domain-containing protein n=1 Tax=Stephanodiscus triporus TaxID=2934178 RepID=A0ABD3QI91_9STRA